MLDPNLDDELMKRVAGGEAEAFAALVERHGPALLRVTRALSSNLADAEDLAQEAFLTALRAAPSYRPGGGTFRPWLFAIARNAWHHSRRRAREIPGLEPDGVPWFELGHAAGWGQETPEFSLAHAESGERLARAVASLSPPDREVLVLCDLEGLTGAEAASLVGTSLPALKSRLHRARLRLMAELREQERGILRQETLVGGLTCSAVLEQLGEYVDGDLNSPARDRIDAHLKGCTVCERFGGRYAGVVHAARERLGAKHDVDDATLTRVKLALGVATDANSK